MAICKLSKSKIAELVRDRYTGRKNDGGNLYCEFQEGAGYWCFLFKRLGRQHYMGLGPLHTVSADEARDEALAYRKHLRAGRDPVVVRKAARAAQKLADDAAKTFDECSAEY